jgi:hypothetical protein
MLTLRRFEVELQLFPLLFGDMQINRLILVEPDIFLETDAKGVGNWLFEVPGEKSKQAESGGGDAAIPHVGRLRIENGLLTYRDGASGETTKIALTSVEATADSPSDPLQLSVIAALNENAVKLTGSVGPLKNAMDPDAPLQIDLAAEGFGVNAMVKGTATAARGALDALVKVSATDLSGLRPLAGNGVPAGLPLNLGAQAKANDGKASLTNIKLTLGKSDLAGTASFDATGEVPVLTADFSGKRLDLSQIQAASKDTATKKTSAASKSKRPGKVLPADKLPLDDLKSINADVKLSLAEVITPQITLNQVSATAKLSKGHLAVQPMGQTLAGSKVDMAASVDAGRKRPAVTFSMTAPKLDVGRLLTESKTTGPGSRHRLLKGEALRSGPFGGRHRRQSEWRHLPVDERGQGEDRSPGHGGWWPVGHCRHDVFGKVGMDRAELRRLPLRYQEGCRHLEGPAG